jgi:Mrp family chromosome partitioning ATPase
MGRMFRVISEKYEHGPSPVRTGPAAIASETIPFVEVGGPDGFITSIAAPKAAPRPAVEAKPVEQPGYLSVQFHPGSAARTAGSDVAAELVAHHFPEHTISGEYRTLRDEIRQQLSEIGPKVLLFTAARPQSGTTTVLLNYAITLAAESPESRVAVIDADFDHPQIAKKLGAADHHGLSDVLGNSVPLAWAVQPSAVSRLQVIPAGTSDMKPAAITDLPRILSQLKQSFDWILIDAGQWGKRPDRDGVSANVDAVYAVTRSTDLERTEFAGLRDRIAHSGGTLRGYITTRV